MSRIGEFIAFQACVSLLRERKMTNILDETYAKCKAGDLEAIRSIYEPFKAEELNAKMVELLRPDGVTTPIELVFQTIEGLHSSIPNHPGDWYFTGHYPPSGGARLAAKSFMAWYEGQAKN